MIKTVNASPLIPALKGTLIAVSVSAVSLLLASALLTESKGLDMISAVLPKIIQVVSAIIGGLIAGKASASRPYVSAVICGLIFGGIITVGSVISGGFEPIYTLISIATVTLSAFVGSLLSKEKPKSSHARKKAMMKMFNN